MNKISIIGSGSFGTAIAQSLSLNRNNEISLLSISKDEVDEINSLHTNKLYFPNRLINETITATLDVESLLLADIIMICIPTKEIEDFIKYNASYFSGDVLVVNLSKGLTKKGEIVTSYLYSNLKTNNIVTLKGPTFASELITGTPSLLTLGFKNKEQYKIIDSIICGTNINIDLSTDLAGVEYLSAL